MSSVYLAPILAPLPNDPLIDIAYQTSLNFTPLSDFVTLIQFLNQLDFPDYISRQVALKRITSAQNFTSPLFTESFDPLQYPLAPPQSQTRFPAFGQFVDLFDPLVSVPLAIVVLNLSYRDSFGDINPYITAYNAATQTLVALLDTGLPYFNQLEFELLFDLAWLPYPIIPCPIHQQSPSTTSEISDSTPSRTPLGTTRKNSRLFWSRSRPSPFRQSPPAV